MEDHGDVVAGDSVAGGGGVVEEDPDWNGIHWVEATATVLVGARSGMVGEHQMQVIVGQTELLRSQSSSSPDPDEDALADGRLALGSSSLGH